MQILAGGYMFSKCRRLKILTMATLTFFSVNMIALPAHAETIFDKIINKDNIMSAVKIVAGVTLIKAVATALFPPTPKKKQQKQKANMNAVESWAKMGETRAQYVLGYMYYFGMYMPKDKDMGMVWWRLAGGQGHGKAMKLAEMGRLKEKIEKPKFSDICYEAGIDAYNGTSAPVSGSEAAKWLNMSIAEGNKNAYGILGSIYLIGLDEVAKNEPQAAKLFFEGMKQKDGLCFYQLGKMFMYGRGGIKQDLDMAASLFMEASSYGIEDADILMTDIISGNVPVQVPDLPPKDDKGGNAAGKDTAPAKNNSAANNNAADNKAGGDSSANSDSSDGNSDADKAVDKMLNDIISGKGLKK